MQFLKKLMASLMIAGITIPAMAILQNLDKQLYTAVNKADLNNVIDLLDKGANPDMTIPDVDIPLLSYAINIYLSCMVPEDLETTRAVAQEILKRCKNPDVLYDGRTVLSNLIALGMNPSFDTGRILIAIDMLLEKVDPFIADGAGATAYDRLLVWIGQVASAGDPKGILSKLKAIKMNMENNRDIR